MAGEKEEKESSLPPEFLAAVERAAERERPESDDTVPAAQSDETPEAVETHKTESPVDEGQGKDPVPAEQGVAEEKSGNEEAAPKISPELVEMARQYGLSEEDVAGMTTEQVAWATKLLDREAAKMLKAQTPATATPTPEKPDEGKPEAQASNPPAKETPEATVPSVEKQIQDLRDKGWDEDMLAVIKTALVKAEKADALEQKLNHIDGYLRQRSEQEQQMVHQRRQQAEMAHTQTLLQGIDALGRPELFGSPDKPLEETQARNLAAMREHIEVLQRVQHQRGLNPALTPELVKRAYEIAFSKQLQHEQAKQKASAVIKQSRSVMGQGRRATVPAKSIPVDEGNVAAHPRIQEFFAKIAADRA